MSRTGVPRSSRTAHVKQVPASEWSDSETPVEAAPSVAVNG